MDRRTFLPAKFETREDTEGLILIGYFARFNTETEIYPSFFESVDPGAFTESLSSDDVRCLFNHDSSIVLGRTGNGTLKLLEDEYGLRGEVTINADDKQALDIYARIKRGDVSGCSFGFCPVEIDSEYRSEDDSYHEVLRKVKLYEVSPCTFPAYPQTDISARQADFNAAKEKYIKMRRKALKERLKSGTEKNHG